jgi:alkanesulfonate monooxygenase SsuD/methylene tetrahydromethanopterin reductase-like flavin-dependent oxidoreductase (luciferase family)
MSDERFERAREDLEEMNALLDELFGPEGEDPPPPQRPLIHRQYGRERG